MTQTSNAGEGQGEGDALDALVAQFSDPLACLRELVQNAVDAGTLQVDVRFEHADGVMTIHVDDYGEGMDRTIIEARLTRLFSSAKDGDLTKIGRFGIGFVSVFALAPDVVCVDTGRGGENWRVVFKPDRTFTRVVLDYPIDGTKVRIMKRVSAEVFAERRERARTVLEYWCKHVDADLTFDGASLSRPMDLVIEGEPACCAVTHEAESTIILAGVHPSGGRFRGFYNQGLTLLEATDPGGEEADFPGVVYKISSRYLEHTLTRDNVVHDAHYLGLMGDVRALIEGPLTLSLVEALSRCEGPDERLIRGAAALLRAPGSRAIESAAFFEDMRGDMISLRDVRRAHTDGRLMTVETAEDGLGAALSARGDLVLVVDPPHDALLTAILGTAVESAHARAVLPEPVREQALVEPWRALHDALIGLLSTAKVTPQEVHLARFGGTIAERLAITQRQFGKPTAVSTLDADPLRQNGTLVVNANHPGLSQLLDLANTEPALAAYTLLRLLLLGRDTDPVEDGALLAQAMEQRWRTR